MTQRGQIVANNAVQIKSDGLNNNQGQIASIKDQLVLNAGTGVLSNQSGSLQSGKDIKVQARPVKDPVRLDQCPGFDRGDGRSGH
ncbi:hypothetical protein IC795_06245 [Acinetobacter seifertii]|uniref:Uncharacterized protein n=1 Tax=Acinetobacter seifertii TaxID=1530123 RepID=A0A7H2Q5C5_9GAMM|nr:hypothetical protein IC795_06245 [Acinetobacter seifertii]